MRAALRPQVNRCHKFSPHINPGIYTIRRFNLLILLITHVCTLKATHYSLLMWVAETLLTPQKGTELWWLRVPVTLGNTQLKAVVLSGATKRRNVKVRFFRAHFKVTWNSAAISFTWIFKSLTEIPWRENNSERSDHHTAEWLNWNQWK